MVKVEPTAAASANKKAASPIARERPLFVVAFGLWPN
jgi:hypothetical protein